MMDKYKGVIRPFLIIRPIAVIVVVIAFFFFYNFFLVDRSLEALKFSLSTVANAETVGSVSYVAPLMQVQFIDELLSADIDTEDLMRLQYSADVIGTSRAERKIADVASIIQEIINKRERQRHPILRFFDKASSFFVTLFKKVPAWRIKEVRDVHINPDILEEINNYENIGEFDKAIKLYRKTIAEFPDYVQAPDLMLHLGYLLHKLGRIQEAKLVYDGVISKFSTLAESKVARELLIKIEKREGLNEQAKELISKTTVTTGKGARQKLYYQLGLIELSGLNLQKAKESFKRAILILPDTSITAQSYLRLGVCERLLGNLDSSVEAFKKASDITRDTELKAQSKYQLAQSYRQKGEYEEAVSTLDDIAAEETDKDVKSLLLFQKGSTLLYDEKDVSKAKRVFDELMRRYSAHALVSSGGETAFVEFIKKNVNLDILSRKPEELEELLEKAWIEALLPKKILKVIESNSNKVVNSLNRMVGGMAKFKEQALNEGIFIEVNLSEREFNSFVKSSLLSSGRADLREIAVEFNGGQRLTINLTIHQGQKLIKVIVSGEFKMVSIAAAPYWITATRRKNLLLFQADRCMIGNIPVPPKIINPLFRPAFENFNESFPLDLEEFKLDKNNMMFAGSVRKDFIKRLKAASAAGSGSLSERSASDFLGSVSVKKLKSRKGG